MAKHHLDLDLSGLFIGDVEKELLFDHPFKAIVENVMEEATTIAEVTDEVAPITPTNLLMNNKAMFGLLFFITQFPSLNFRHSSLITHHSSLIT